MLRSYKLTGSLYIAFGMLSAGAGIFSGHDMLAGVGAVFFCIGAVLLLGNTATHVTPRSTASADTAAHHNGQASPH